MAKSFAILRVLNLLAFISFYKAAYSKRLTFYFLALVGFLASL